MATTYRITLRCRNRAGEIFDRDYRIEAWTREDAIRKARNLASMQQGFSSSEVTYCMPAFVSELSR